MKKLLLLAVSLSLLSGCASIVSGRPELVTFNSDPPDAKIIVCNERTGQCITTGQTPYAIPLERGQGFFKPAKYSLKCEKEGYEPCTRTLEAGLNGWYAGNIIFGGLIGLLIVDPATGAMWDIKEHTITMSLVEKGIRQEEIQITPDKAVLKEEKEGKPM